MRFLTVLLCMALAGAGAPLAIAAGLTTEDFYRAARLLVIATALLIVLKRGYLTRLIVRDKWLVAFVVWAGLSTAWAVDLSSALSGVGTIFGATVAGAVLARHGARAAAWLARLMTGLVLVSLALWALAPEIATVSPTQFRPGEPVATGRLSGIFAWNADMGFVAAIGVVLTLTLAMMTKSPGKWLLALGVNVAAVLLSGSATAIVATAAVALVVGVRFRPESPGMRTIRTLTLPATLLGLLFYLTGEATPDGLLGLVGKDETLTGRTAIWEAATSRVYGMDAWIGAGLESFWSSPSGLMAAAHLHFDPGHAHNGYIQTYLDLGWIGLGLFAMSLSGTLWRTLQLGSGVGQATVVSVVVLFVIVNLTNNYIVAAHLLLACYAWAAFSLREPSEPSEPVAASAPSVTRKPPVRRRVGR